MTNNSIFVVLLISLNTIMSYAQNEVDSTMTIEKMAKKRQDPVAGLRSIYLQEVLLPVGDGTASSFSIQPVFPIKLAKNLKLITYTIIPFQSVPSFSGLGQVPIKTSTIVGDASGGHASGLGNILFNGYFSSIEKKGNVSWGAGPAIQIPTRTDPALGSNTVSMGPSFMYSHSGDTFSAGFVVQNYWSLGGTGVNEVNSFSLQYFAYYNLPKAWNFLTNATIVNN